MKRNSWHYKLAKAGSPTGSVYNVNLCQYLRYMLFGALLWIAFTSITVGLGCWMVVGVYQLVGTYLGITEIGFAGNLLLATLLVIALFLIAGLVGYFIQIGAKSFRGKVYEWRRGDRKSLGHLIYRTYKDKVCFNVEFED